MTTGTLLRLGVLTTGRQDWGILRSTCKLARTTAGLDLTILAGGMALSAAHGASAAAMASDGLPPDERIDWLALGHHSVHQQSGAATSMIGDVLERLHIDALMVAGDRFETMSAALAATVARVPHVHLHGGEKTEGAFDNAIRHAITKLAHLHLVSHAEYGRRVITMGEDPAAVHVVGAPGLDNLYRDDLPTHTELEKRIGIPLAGPIVIVTLHPSTLGADPATEVASVCAAMDACDATYVITLPNNDPGARVIRTALEEAAQKPGRVAVESLGERFYWALMKSADAMLGNSSSAIVEAPAVALPAVNVGSRQKGRLRAPNVIDVEPEGTEVTKALRCALDPSFRLSIGDASRSAFGDGHAAERILSILASWTPPRPPIKRWTPTGKPNAA